MQRYFLHLAYDGTRYSGWQIQPHVKTVQETIEKALRIFVPDLKCIVGCGRTDAGVHAKNYYAHFDTATELIPDLVYKLNAILPLDISIMSCFSTNEHVHARFGASHRTYEYFVHFEKNPFKNHYSVYHNHALNIDAMNEACQYLLGEHDFSAFSKSRTQTYTNICIVKFAEWKTINGDMVFTITANRFLRNMVRAIVGTMFKIGEGEIAPAEMATIIAGKDRSAAGKSVHPQGLFLSNIHYPAFHGPSNRQGI